eukprot:scaffold1727_cov133-Cylindrotheca_fusiformis.AAC.61
MPESKAASLGEELWNVHLRRETATPRTEDDFDHSPRKRLHSVGEELWEIHMKRSRGIDLSFDTEENFQKPDAKENTTENKVSIRYNLRKRKAKQ